MVREPPLALGVEVVAVAQRRVRAPGVRGQHARLAAGAAVVLGVPGEGRAVEAVVAGALDVERGVGARAGLEEEAGFLGRFLGRPRVELPFEFVDGVGRVVGGVGVVPGCGGVVAAFAAAAVGDDEGGEVLLGVWEGVLGIVFEFAAYFVHAAPIEGAGGAAHAGEDAVCHAVAMGGVLEVVLVDDVLVLPKFMERNVGIGVTVIYWY